jgi:phosphoglycerate dehydrogenase-like enzyme
LKPGLKQGRAARRSSATMTASRSAPPPRSRRRCSPPRPKLKVVGRAGIGVDNVDIRPRRRAASS